MKIPLELNVTVNKTYLNFWDSQTGNDVIAEFKNGKLWHTSDDGVRTAISLEDYIYWVLAEVNKEKN